MTSPSQQHLPNNEEIHQWIKEYQTNATEEVKTKLVLHFQRLIHSLARRFAKGQELFEDLVQVGMLGLMGALARFDPAIGRSFESFAVPTIVGEMKRYIRDKTWSVHVPRRIKELTPTIKNSIEELTICYQRSPQVQEVAAHLGVTEEEVLEALEIGRSYQALSVDIEFESDQEGRTVTLLDIIGELEEGYEQVHEKLVLEKIFSVLNEREKDIIQLTFIYGLSQKETGDLLHISQMHVSRIQRRALQKLKENFIFLNRESS